MMPALCRSSNAKVSPSSSSYRCLDASGCTDDTAADISAESILSYPENVGALSSCLNGELPDISLVMSAHNSLEYDDQAGETDGDTASVPNDARDDIDRVGWMPSAISKR